MGIGGWDFLQDNVGLVGTVVAHEYSGSFFEGDDDWSITIQPAPGFEWIARSNEAGRVECEIRTPIDDQQSEEVQFGELMGQVVKLWGCWCMDVSHDHKTELHRLMLLIWDSGPVMGTRKRVKVMVFSDHSPPFMVIPPRPSPLHRDESTHATFGIDFPAAPHDDVEPVFSFASEKNMTDSRNFTVSGTLGSFTLNGDILSGHGDGKGYYRAHIDLDYNTSLQPSCIGLLQPASNEHYGSYGWSPRDFFDLAQSAIRGEHSGNQTSKLHHQ